MQTITGKIKCISEEVLYGTGNKKKEVVVTTLDNQSAKLEFRDHLLRDLNDFHQHDAVQVVFQMRVSTSKKSNITYNNLIAKSIKRIVL